MQPFDLVILALATYYAAVTLAKLHGPLGLAESMRHAVYRRRGFTADRMGLLDPGLVWHRVTDAPRPGAEPILESTDDDWLAAGVSCPLCLSLYAGAALALVWLVGGAAGQAAVGVLAVAGGASALFSMGRYW